MPRSQAPTPARSLHNIALHAGLAGLALLGLGELLARGGRRGRQRGLQMRCDGGQRVGPEDAVVHHRRQPGRLCAPARAGMWRCVGRLCSDSIVQVALMAASLVRAPLLSPTSPAPTFPLQLATGRPHTPHPTVCRARNVLRLSPSLLRGLSCACASVVTPMSANEAARVLKS